MKMRIIILLTAFLISGCNQSNDTNTTTPAGDNAEVVNVYDEPMHKLVFEDKSFKILDVQISPGDTTLFHLHENPILFVSMGLQQGAEQEYNSSEWMPIDAWAKGGFQSDLTYLDEPLKHRVTNLDDDPSRLIAIMNMGNEMNRSQDQGNYEISDNWFRAKRLFLDPGDRLGFGDLSFPTVLVLISDGTLQIVDDGQEIEIDTIWHVLENDQLLINSSAGRIEVIQAEVLDDQSAY